MSNSREVAGQIDSMNRKNIEPLPASLLRAAEAYHIYVHSISPEPRLRTVGTGSYLVQGKEKGKRYATPVKIPATVYTTCISDTGGFVYKPSDGMSVAKDIVQIGQMSDLTKEGLFISENEIPTEEELQAAEQARVDMLSKRVQDADQYYQVNGGVENTSRGTFSNIQDGHRAALKELGWSRPWSTKNVQMTECWNCGRSVLPSTVKCFHEGCGAPLKNEEAKARFIAQDEDEPVRRGPGRPKAS